MTTLQLDIPLDVCFAVIDTVATDDSESLATLRACALTCRAWLARARIHLYRHVTLENSEELEQFLRTVAHTGELGALVRTLRLVAFIGNKSQCKSSSQISGPLLPNLQVLMVESHMWLGCKLRDLTSLISEFSVATKSLKQLRIWGFLVGNLADFVRVFEHFPSISTLCITGCFWLNVDILPCIKGPDHGFGRDLSKLVLDGNLVEEPILRITPSWLKSLELGLPVDCRDPVNQENCFEELARFTELEHLKMKTYALDADSPCQWIIEVLNSVRCTTLRTLDLDYWGDLGPLKATIGYSQMSMLDHVLSRAPFANVRRLCFRISTNSDNAAEVIAMEEHSKNHILASFRGCQKRAVEIGIVVDVRYTG
ncbi:hypothetical protein BV20DRAFT_1113697 [Pilatotrama ljubarskyi]|nr:hypothetical protein BV20DRAFT_1113697 [Pilatotrama ljubarskyi]